MKKSIKVLGTTALILAFAAAPALARNNRPSKGNNMPDFAQMNNCPVYAQNCQPGFNGQNKKAGRNGCGIGRISMLGTVSAIDESKSILTVSDIDGVEHKVHIIVRRTDGIGLVIPFHTVDGLLVGHLITWPVGAVAQCIP